MEEVPGEHAHAGPDRTLPRLAAPLPHRRASSSPRELTAILDRALALKQAPAALARAGGPHGRAAVRAALDAHAHVVRGRGRSSSAATRWCCAPTSCSSRAGSRCATPRSCSPATSRAIGLRTVSDERLDELAEHATVPVVNMLSPRHHPCQALADLMTLREAFGAIEGRRLAYVGDGNNVARSLAIVGALAGVEVAVAAPDGYQLEDGLGAQLTSDPAEAVAGADAVYTDVWVSMSDADDEAAARREALAPYRLDDALLDRAAPRRVRAALPAGAPRRGDHRGRALRRAPADLGPGREPAARAEGAARVPRFAGGTVCRPMPHEQVVRPVRAIEGVHRAQGDLDVAQAPQRRRRASSSSASSTRARSSSSRASACRRRSTRPSSAGA